MLDTWVLAEALATGDVVALGSGYFVVRDGQGTPRQAVMARRGTPLKQAQYPCHADLHGASRSTCGTRSLTNPLGIPMPLVSVSIRSPM